MEHVPTNGAELFDTGRLLALSTGELTMSTVIRLVAGDDKMCHSGIYITGEELTVFKLLLLSFSLLILI